MSSGNLGYIFILIVLIPFILGGVVSIVAVALQFFGVFSYGWFVSIPVIVGFVLSGMVYIGLALKNG